MSRKDSNQIHPESVYEESLVNLLPSTMWSIEAFLKLLDTHAWDDDHIRPMLQILKPLLDRQKADLEKIEEIISRTLGTIRFTVCRHYMQIGGKTYYEGDFLKAVLIPPDKAPQPEPEGGEA